MCEKIETIKKLKEKVESIRKSLVKEKYEIVYRAFSNKNKNKDMKEEKPSLFYDSKLIDNENEIYHDFIAAKPNEFENMTTFDTLTKMRHYEVPNRLLDVTFDPLLALFFAYGEKESVTLKKIKDLINKKIYGIDDKQKIQKLEDKIKEIANCLELEEEDFNGSKIICVYVVKKENIKNYDSDAVTVLSILTKLKKDQKKMLKKIVDSFKKTITTFKAGKQQRVSFKDFEELIDEINETDKRVNEEKKIKIDKKISIWLRTKNKNDNRKDSYSLFDVYKILPKQEEIIINIAKEYYGNNPIPSKLTNIKKTSIKEFIEKNSEHKISDLISFFKNDKINLEGVLKNLIVHEKLKDILCNFFDEKDRQKIYSELQTTIKPNTKIFTVNELFNFFVSTCVPELNWQLKQEIPGWYENVLDLDTFTQCYLVKPKMNNPRIIAQSGAFFIYPFKDTDIKKSLLNTDDNEIVFEITEEIKEELNLLNIKETKYMPDDLTKYAKEIKEDDKYKDNENA